MYYSVNQSYKDHELIASFNIPEYPLSKSQHDDKMYFCYNLKRQIYIILLQIIKNRTLKKKKSNTAF